MPSKKEKKRKSIIVNEQKYIVLRTISRENETCKQLWRGYGIFLKQIKECDSKVTPSALCMLNKSGATP